MAACCGAVPLLAQGRSAVDSTLRARADSIQRADSATGALPQAEVPLLTEVGMSHRWNRDSLFSTGALTLADFLDRVPGLMTLRARFYMAPQAAAYNGDVGRMRLFLDGVELENIDARGGGVTELSQFPIAAIEELVIERGANELRVLMRSWRGPLRYTAQTRADIFTGDNRSNTFRGFLARRTRSGFAFQAMLQRRSTDDRQLGGDGDATAIFTRLGVIRPSWSLDATLVRVRSTQQSLELINVSSYLATGRELPRYDQIQRDAYLRFATGDASRGAWVQVVAASRQNVENTPARSADPGRGFAADSADTTTNSAQFVATAGWTGSRTRLSLTERVRLVNGATLHQPAARAEFEIGRFAASAYVERNPFAKLTRGDAFARVRAGSHLAFTGAVSYGTRGTELLRRDSTDELILAGLPVAMAARAEVAVRLGQLWLQGGAVIRDSAVLRAPVIFDRATPPVQDGRALGAVFTVVGPLFRGFSVHLSGVAWDVPGMYRPRIQTRSELTWRYHWTGATRTGGFDFLLGGQAEYATRSFVPLLSPDGSFTTLPTFAATPLGLRAEFRLKDATISAQIRNIANVPYTTVPGLLMPGPLAVYGVRWTFWN